MSWTEASTTSQVLSWGPKLEPCTPQLLDKNNKSLSAKQKVHTKVHKTFHASSSLNLSVSEGLNFSSC